MTTTDAQIMLMRTRCEAATPVAKSVRRQPFCSCRNDARFYSVYSVERTKKAQKSVKIPT
jgi:hypothetical protein